MPEGGEEALASPRGLGLDRRAFLRTLSGSLLATPLAAEAQPAGKVYRIGVLESTFPALNAANLAVF